MRWRKRSFRNCWIAIRASPGGAATRCASRAVVPGRGSHRPEEQPDPGLGAHRQPAGGSEGSRLCLGLCVWCGLPSGGQSGGAEHANLQYSGDEPSSARDQQPSRRRCPCCGDLGRAGWHRSQGLVVPGNITLLELPPYSPELNPVERIWHYLRSHWLANSVFPSLTSWMPASRRRTGLPTITPWCVRSARSPGLRLRPLFRCCLLSSRGLTEKYTHVQRFPEIGIIQYYSSTKNGSLTGVCAGTRASARGA